MECDRVKDLYKKTCRNIIPNIYLQTFSEEENAKIKACVDSIKLFEDHCFLKKEKGKRQNEKHQNV
jgi:hypothetical protein